MAYRIDVDLESDEWQALRKAVEATFEQYAGNILERGARAAMLELEKIARAQLPPPVRRRPQARYWTDRQRRWWWATMRAKAEGRAPYALPGWSARYQDVDGRRQLVLSGSYKRTNTAIKGLEASVKRSGVDISGTFGTGVDYARYILDETDQAEYHKGNWPTLQDILEGALQRMTTKFGDQVGRALRDYLEALD